MKAVVAVGAGGPEVLRTVDVDEPRPLGSEVVVAARLVGVNFADINARRGVYAPGPRGGEARGLGLEVLGTVVACGEGASRLRPGDRVAGFSKGPAYAELVPAEEDLLWKVPPEVSDEQGAAFPVVGHTAFHLLASAARLRSGESVLVTAAGGGVGTTAIQVARLLGAGPITAAAGSGEALALAMECGAGAAIDYSASALDDALAAGGGVDVALDGVGGEVRQQALRSLAVFGRLVQFGNSSGLPETLPSPREMRERCAGVIGFHLTYLRSRRRDLLATSAERLLAWMAGQSLRIVIAGVLPMADVAEAHRRLEDRSVRGKQLLAVAGGLA